MKNQFYFQFYVTPEQVDYTQRLVAYSLENHPIRNIWDKYDDKKTNTAIYRFTGSLGETVFADAYGLPRKTKSFGAIDGQDYGEDFKLMIDENTLAIDTKSMQRKGNVFFKDYVQNIPASQLHKPNSKTDIYFCISFHRTVNQWIASFLGAIYKKELQTGRVGAFFKDGTWRIRKDKSSFQFLEDTYEVEFEDISSPWLTPYIKSLKGFKLLYLK